MARQTATGNTGATVGAVKAVVYDKPRSFTVTQVPDPHAGPGELRLRVVLAGVCGTDAHLHDGQFDPVTHSRRATRSSAKSTRSAKA